MSKKKNWLIMLACFLPFVMLSCTSTPQSPLNTTGNGTLSAQYLNNTFKNYNILGLIQVERRFRSDLNYADIIAEAIRVYPNVNALLNLRIDTIYRLNSRGSRILMYAATAIAIEFTDGKVTFEL